MKILVTGFDPFGKDEINPALEVVKRLPDEIAGAQIIKLEVPTVFQKSADVTNEAVRKHHPDVVVNIGQAGGRKGITPERVAINTDDARIADNEGQQPIDEWIHEEGPAAYFSTLPIKAITAAIQKADIPASVSNSAGTYVCNHLMYQTLHLAATEFPEMKAGFIHIPLMDGQDLEGKYPSLPLEEMVRGIEIALATIVEFHDRPDLKTAEGTIA